MNLLFSKRVEVDHQAAPKLAGRCRPAARRKAAARLGCWRKGFSRIPERPLGFPCFHSTDPPQSRGITNMFAGDTKPLASNSERIRVSVQRSHLDLGPSP